MHRFSMKRSPENPREKAWMSYRAVGFSPRGYEMTPSYFRRTQKGKGIKMTSSLFNSNSIALPYTLLVFNFAILAREYFWRGFISAISTRKYEKRALNFAIYALSTSFNFFLKEV